MWKLKVSETNVATALATGQDTAEVSPPVGVGVQENFHILGANWCILRPFSVFFWAYLSLLKVLRSWVNRFWKDLSITLSDAFWTAALR